MIMMLLHCPKLQNNAEWSFKSGDTFEKQYQTHLLRCALVYFLYFDGSRILEGLSE